MLSFAATTTVPTNKEQGLQQLDSKDSCTNSSPHRISIADSISENNNSNTNNNTNDDENEKMLEKMRQEALARMFGEPFVMASSSPKKEEEVVISSASGNSSDSTENNSTEGLRRDQEEKQKEEEVVEAIATETTTGNSQLNEVGTSKLNDEEMGGGSQQEEEEEEDSTQLTDCGEKSSRVIDVDEGITTSATNTNAATAVTTTSQQPQLSDKNDQKAEQEQKHLAVLLPLEENMEPKDDKTATDEPSSNGKGEKADKHMNDDDDTANAHPTDVIMTTSAIATTTAASAPTTMVSDDDDSSLEKRQEEQQQDAHKSQPTMQKEQNVVCCNNNDNKGAQEMGKEQQQEEHKKDDDAISTTIPDNKEQQPDPAVVAGATKTNPQQDTAATVVEERAAEIRCSEDDDEEENTPTNDEEDPMDTTACSDPEQEMEDQLEALCRAEVEAEAARLRAQQELPTTPERQVAELVLDRSDTSTPEPSKSSTVVTPEVVVPPEPKPETPKSATEAVEDKGEIPVPVSSGPLLVKSQPSGEATGSSGSSTANIKDASEFQPAAAAAQEEIQPLAVQNLYYPHAIDVQMACKGKKFPEQLMLLMTHNVSEESLWWSSGGNGTIFVLDCAWFRDCVMRAFFPNNPFRRITNTLKRWGFRKQHLSLPEGVMAFHHPLFRRGQPELASKIVLPVVQARPNARRTSKPQMKRRTSEERHLMMAHNQTSRVMEEYSKRRELDEYNRMRLKAMQAQKKMTTTKGSRAQVGGVPPSVRIASLRREGSTASASQDPPCSHKVSSRRTTSSTRLKSQPTRRSQQRDADVVDLTNGGNERTQFLQREARRALEQAAKKRKLGLQNRPNESICSVGQTHMPGYYEGKIANKYRMAYGGSDNRVADDVRSKISSKKRKPEDALLTDGKKSRGTTVPSPTCLSSTMDETATTKVLEESSIERAIEEERALLKAMQRKRELRLQQGKIAAAARARDRMAEQQQRQYRVQQAEEDDETERRKRLASALYGSARPAAKKESNVPSKPKTTAPKSERRRERPAATECKPKAKAPSSVASTVAAPTPAASPAEPSRPALATPTAPAPPAAPRQARPAILPPPPPPINQIHQVHGLAGLGQPAGVGLPATADLLSTALTSSPAVTPQSLLVGAVADMLHQQEMQQRQQQRQLQHQQDLAALHGLLAASGLQTTGFIAPPPPVIPAAAQPTLQDLLLLQSLQQS